MWRVRNQTDTVPGIEYHPTTVPKPSIFDVLVDGKTVAFLEYEAVRAAVARFEEMKASHDRHMERVQSLTESKP